MLETITGLVDKYHYLQVQLSSMRLEMAADFMIIIIFAAIMGVIATRLKQPTIIAYIIAGLMLGPAVFGFVELCDMTYTIAELGLAFLLFLLGIKMRLNDIKPILLPLVKISVPQMLLVAIAGFLIASGLGFSTIEAILIGIAVMYSSTAVIIKMLTDKGTATSFHGKIDIGILLLQDIVVVILLTLLATGQPESMVDVLWSLLIVLGLVGLIAIIATIGSLYFLPPLFRFIASNQKIFFLISISWVFLFVLASYQLDLSIEIGAFLAGLAIAQMPYSKELQARVAPLTDLFILVFFVSVGLELDGTTLIAYWKEALIASFVLMGIKFFIFIILISWQKFDAETCFIGSINMIQVSEFGLIVGTVAVAGGFIDSTILGFLAIVTLLTMSISVYFIKYNEQLYNLSKPLLNRFIGERKKMQTTTDFKNHAVVIGFDEIARRVAFLLQDRYAEIVVIDRNIDNDEAVEEAGLHAVFGDAKYKKIRKEAGLKYADFVFSSSVQVDINETILNETKNETVVFVEAQTTQDAIKLYDCGADYVVLSSLQATEQLKYYLNAYIVDPDNFENVLKKDLEFLKSSQLFSKNNNSRSKKNG